MSAEEHFYNAQEAWQGASLEDKSNIDYGFEDAACGKLEELVDDNGYNLSDIGDGYQDIDDLYSDIVDGEDPEGLGSELEDWANEEYEPDGESLYLNKYVTYGMGDYRSFATEYGPAVAVDYDEGELEDPERTSYGFSSVSDSACGTVMSKQLFEAYNKANPEHKLEEKSHFSVDDAESINVSLFKD